MARTQTTRLLVLSAILFASAVYTARASVTEPVKIRESFVTFPNNIDGWTGRKLPDFTEDILKVLGVDEYLNRAYQRDARTGVGLYVGYYESQRQGDAIHSPLNCLPGAGWEALSKSYLPVSVLTAPADQGGTPKTIEINRYVIRKGLDKQVVLYWYQSQGRVVANEYWSKIYMVLGAIKSNRTDAAMVRVIAPILGNDAASEAKAEQSAVDFVKALYPHLGRYLPN